MSKKPTNPTDQPMPEQHAPDVAEAIAGEQQKPESDSPPIVPIGQLLTEFKTLHEIVIDGYLRRGETGNLVSLPKRGKTWLVLCLAFAVALGRTWLGLVCRKGRVLIVDAELHPATIAHRIRTVATALEVDHSETEIDVLSLRGQCCDLTALSIHLDQVGPGKYELLILDALYRFLPAGTSENDNAAMMAVYNQIDQIAKRLECAVVIVHHTSKGNQSDKAVTDVGSGAGSISRAADTHLVIRDHEEPGYQVLEAVARSFVSPEPKSIFFKYPIWLESELEPKTKSSGSNKRAENDQATKDAILKALQSANGRPVTFTVLKAKTGFGVDRIRRGVALLSDQIKQFRKKSKKSNRMAEMFLLVDGLKVGLKDSLDQKSVDGDGLRVS